MDKVLNMTVGQTEIHPIIKASINDSIPVPSYFKEYKAIQASMLEKAQKIIGTKNTVYLRLGTGRVGLETGLYNIVDDNTRVLTIDNGQWGHFGGTLAENMGAKVDFLTGEKGKQIDFKKLKSMLSKEKYDIVTMVQNETQTGALYEPKKVKEIIEDVSKDTLLFVDGISCFGGAEIKFDEWDLDVYVTGSQKCLNAPQGCPLVVYSKKATNRMNKIKPTKHFYFSMDLDNSPEFLFARALNDVFEYMLDEGLENIYARHERAAKAVRKGLTALGLKYMADEKIASPSTTRIVFPDELQKQIDEDRVKNGIDGDRVTVMMKDKFGVCIAEDRVGTMGFYTRKSDVMATIIALSKTLTELGYTNDIELAKKAVENVYKK
ncbi:MAG: aminotransferase class V-fold PLP-dependent enzyme [Clostridia bacterium]|nr:aminotransferase class V-fold PLP-dependent enzyme [Clostridia bacterium]